ncbi:MAG TPA: hypothetical protein VH540_24835 [Ktedonobacterales bacterium]|jgi:peptidoglycan hydrolase CwlO-like protein
MDIRQSIQTLQQQLGEQEQLLLTLQAEQDREQEHHQALCQEREALLEALLQRQSSTALSATRNTAMLVQARVAVLHCELAIASSRVRAIAARVRSVLQASCATQLALEQLQPKGSLS